MARILILVEGQSEETFVKEILAPHLLNVGHYAGARLVGNARLRLNRGGIRPWPSTKKDIIRHLQNDVHVYVTTMVDYYGLPSIGNGAWPGRATAGSLAFSQKAPAVCAELLKDISQTMDNGFNTSRFIPFVMMHEFEGLLFSDCQAFANGIGKPALGGSLQSIRSSFSTPEEINDSPHTAPSKRLLALMPEYQKPFQGNIGALVVGLAAIRAECPIFDQWVTVLETLP